MVLNPALFCRTCDFRSSFLPSRFNSFCFSGSEFRRKSDRFDCLEMSCLSCLPQFYLLLSILIAPVFSQSSMVNTRVLQVGKELWKETLPLHGGSCLYQLQGLKSNTLYEVKISYPASIPASFSIKLQKGSSDVGLNIGRKLLDTEKLIFKTEVLDSLSDQTGFYASVNVVPGGVVAIPVVQDRKYVTFNIVCDELLMGIPHKAWCVVILILICLGFAFVIPSFLPPVILPKNQNPNRASLVVSKDS